MADLSEEARLLCAVITVVKMRYAAEVPLEVLMPDLIAAGRALMRYCEGGETRDWLRKQLGGE